MGRPKRPENKNLRSKHDVLNDRVIEEVGAENMKYGKWSQADKDLFFDYYIFKGKSEFRIAVLLCRTYKSIEGRRDSLYRGEWSPSPAKISRDKCTYEKVTNRGIECTRERDYIASELSHGKSFELIAAALGRTVNGLTEWWEKSQGRKPRSLLDIVESTPVSDAAAEQRALLVAHFEITISSLSTAQLKAFNSHYNQVMGIVIDKLRAIIELEGYRVV